LGESRRLQVKKVVIALLAIGLLLTVFSNAALGKSHRVQLLKESFVNGVKLEPGKYKVEMGQGDYAEIYHGRELVVKVKAEVVPLGDSIPNSVRQMSDGTLTEIRLKKEKLVLIEESVAGKASE
jgi:hypothetical protein